MEAGHVLIVDDEPTILGTLKKALTLEQYRVDVAGGANLADRKIRTGEHDLVLLDVALPDGDGVELLRGWRQRGVTTPVVMMSGHATIDLAVRALQLGALDFLEKPLSTDRLLVVIDNALRLVRAEAEKEQLRREAGYFDELIGASASMRELGDRLARVAPTRAPVLITGERGTGKELVAKALHRLSPRHAKPLEKLNCAAVPKDLIESELFGHEKGAFTGATHRKPGVFELANEGTLFLDEITEMPIDLQPNLLRVLETRKVTRLGATSSIDVQCRVVSATNRTEADIVENNLLREDLYFRLAVFPIRIAPLRERKEDIPLLVEHFLHIFNRDYGSNVGIRDEDMERLMHHDWPGNVRELRHALHRGFIMAESSKNVIQLPAELASPFSRSVQHKDKGITVGKTVEDVERELIETTLNHLGGDKKKAADMLGISLKTLYNRLNSYSP